MKKAWIILIISALTDALLTIINGVTSAMANGGEIMMPNKLVILINVLFGTAAFLRTVQQALKASPETSAALSGAFSRTVSIVEEETPNK